MKNIKLEINGKDYNVDILRVGEFDADLRINNRSYKVNIKDLGSIQESVETVLPVNSVVERTNYAENNKNPSSSNSTPAASINIIKPTSSSKDIIAPLPGVILDIKIGVGDEIKAGQTVLIMEAMKMENEIASEIDGVVKEIKFRKEDAVLEGDVLVELV